MKREPSETSLARIRAYVAKYRAKTGTAAHPEADVGEAVIKGLALHLDVLGKPLCPCNFYEDKAEEAKQSTWICACDEMQKYKYCH